MSLGGRVVALVAGVLLCATSCTTEDCGSAAGEIALASCVAAAKVDGRQYVELELHRSVPRRLMVASASADGVYDACDDFGASGCEPIDEPSDAGITFATSRIRGIPAAEVLLRNGGRGVRRTLLIRADANYSMIISPAVERLVERYNGPRRRGDHAAPATPPISLTDPSTAYRPRLSGGRWGMPAAIPTDEAALPSLLDDPPGRAVVAVAPDITVLNAPVISWSEIEILFYGTDGHWRRLDLGDLGLPASLTYTDTYGAGMLSPDGRWWFGLTREGVVLLDLGTGRTRLVALRGPSGFAAWEPGRRAVLAGRAAADRIVIDARRVPPASPLAVRKRPHPHATIGAVVSDPATGRKVGELTYPRGILVNNDVWLDEETLLVATTPTWFAWRPATGELYRLTDARTLGDYWAISAVPR